MEAISTFNLENLVILLQQPIESSISLGAFSNIRRLCIEQEGGYGPGRMGFFPQLAKLIAQSPGLSHLELNLQWTRFADLLLAMDECDIVSPLPLKHLGLMSMDILPEDIRKLDRHFRELKSLILQCNPQWNIYGNELSYGRHWESLQSQNIHLDCLSTDCIVGDVFISYLNSFAGLKHLRLNLEPLQPLNQLKPQYPLWLLQSLVSHHLESLVELDLEAYTGSEEWMWPFSDHLLPLLRSLQNLKYFGVTCIDKEVPNLSDSKLQGDKIDSIVSKLSSHCLGILDF